MPNAVRLIDDHGDMTGLGDNDHPQYTQTRDLFAPDRVYTTTGSMAGNNTVASISLTAHFQYAIPLVFNNCTKNRLINALMIKTNSAPSGGNAKIYLYSTNSSMTVSTYIQTIATFTLATLTVKLFDLSLAPIDVSSEPYYLLVYHADQTSTGNAARGSPWGFSSSFTQIENFFFSRNYSLGPEPVINTWGIGIGSNGFLNHILVKYQ